MTFSEFDDKLYEVNSSDKIAQIKGVYDNTSIYFVKTGDEGEGHKLVKFSGECMFKVEDIDKVIKALQEIKRKS